MCDPLEIQLRLSGMVDESIVDGPGIRFVVFLQGCPHHCPGCHNPETHDPAGGKIYTAREILTAIEKNPLIQGVTFSGGEPFAQAAALLPLAQALAKKGYHLTFFSGYTFADLLALSAKNSAIQGLLSTGNLLIDGPFILAQRSLLLPFRGSKNQRILSLPESLAAGSAVLAEF